MKIKELKEKQPLEVIEVSKHIIFPGFPDPYTGEKEPDIIKEEKRIQMRVFTDGEVEKETGETSKNIYEYYIDKRKYGSDVDTLKTKELFFKNHSFVIVYLLASEVITIGNVCGRFDVVKDVSIYLKNYKDKIALRNAKQIINEIKNHNQGYNYSSLFGMLFSKGKEFKKIEFEEARDNIYTLKKTNKF